MGKKYSIGDKFYRITGGLLSAMPQLKIETVTKIIETDRGFEYNDGIQERYMWTDLYKAKEELAKRIDDEYGRAKQAVVNYSEKLS